MKTLLHTSLLFFTILLSGNVKAQTTISLSITPDSMAVHCPLPAAAGLNGYGVTTGYNDVTDNMTLQVFWGDGTDTTFIADLIDGGGITDYFWTNIPHNYYMAGTYSPMLIATGPDGNDDTSYVLPFTMSSSCVIIDGYLYFDNNSNCVYDGGDTPVVNAHAIVTNAGGGVEGIAYSNIFGYYSMSIPLSPSTFSITGVGGFLNTVCPASGSYSFIPSGSTSFDIGLACILTSTDYYTHHTGMCGYGPPGGTGVISFTAAVLGCSGISGPATITLTLDPLVTFTGTMFSGPAPTTISGGGSILTWNTTLTSSSSWAGLNLSLETFTSTSAIVLSPSCWNMNITGPGSDPNLTNNNEYHCLTIGGPYDPNNKEVMPAGLGITGDVPPNTQFDYLINFQNCGTAEAINIYVMDTMDTDLDMSTFQITGSSYAMNPIFTGANIVRFDFPNIHLIDSVANEPLSHGWVTYTVKAKSGLANGTQIENTAHIYFDYNPAVVTNTTLNTIDISLGLAEPVEVAMNNVLFPNPATNNVNIHFENNVTGTIYLVDVTGKQVKSIDVKNTNEIQISLNDISAGFYGITMPGVQLKQNRLQVIK